MRLSSFRLWVFDLDGTPVDSRLDLANAVNATLESRGLAPQPEDLIVSFVGDGADDLLRRSFEAAGAKPGDSLLGAGFSGLMREFLDYYGAHCLDRTAPYPGAREFLGALAARGLPLAILTHKPARATETVLAGLGLRDLFRHIVPGDGPLGKKPDPAGLAYILKAMNASPLDSVLVGDSLQDLRTARAAGTSFVAYSGGLGDAESVAAAGPDFSTDSFHALLAKLESET
jgi:phosphoglycolate phosphatase